MPPVSKWTPITRFPITKLISQHVKKFAGKKINAQSGYVSEELCSHSLQRLAPYLHRNKPLDIIDLWPGDGVWSSQVNEYLQPRRHIMIEPDLDAYGPLLKPLAKTKSSFKLASGNIYTTNWTDVFSKYLPEQSPPEKTESGSLPKNDTLLVLAKPPIPNSPKDHYTPARWWAAVMESCMLQTGLNAYGSVRILATFPLLEIQSILPRTVFDRKRPALLTENVALHAFEVASSYEPEPWYSLKTWDSIKHNFQRVSERAAAQGVETPAGREGPALELAPDSPKPQKGIPYHPRARTEGHDHFMQIIEKHAKMEAKSTPDDPKLVKSKRDASRAMTSLKFDNHTALIRESLTADQMAIDGRMRDLSVAAADPNITATKLQELDKEVENMQSALTQRISQIHFRLHRSWDRNLDDARIEARSQNLDDSVLLWDKRPFHPLHIKSDEVFPGAARTLVYFEAEEKPAAIHGLRNVPVEKRQQLMQLFEALSGAFGTRHHMTIAELTDAIFPGRTANELVQSMPGLIKYAAKRLKPDCGPIPLPEGHTNPEECYQENIDYDLSDCRLRCLPAQTLWEIVLEYQKDALDLSSLQFLRLLGGTLTSFRAGDYSVYEAKSMR
ncbi:hypothetical protein N7456_000278 [Penicillium angulare]|uniref:rRNA adenine N(6)-methyltransferase n=1 Tax=Penicillium angulare TaxID=116970 RepID=A0A9W9GCP9_9EURO|nr:hypothetical protein N7456_000278 [Penicillium angulare]